VEVEVDEAEVAGNTVVEVHDMVGLVVLQEKAAAAGMMVPDIGDLVVLEVDQVENSKGLAEGQEESGSVETDLKVELEVTYSAGE
jgi:hypothetical protein